MAHPGPPLRLGPGTTMKAEIARIGRSLALISQSGHRSGKIASCCLAARIFDADSGVNTAFVIREQASHA